MCPVPACREIIYGVLKNTSMIDFEGHMSKVVFTGGCNFGCGFCHNSEMITAKGEVSWQEFDRNLNKAKEQWADAVVISGGEPLMHKEIPGLISYIREKGFLIKLDTNGSFPDRLAEVIDSVDYVAMDYKASLSRYSLAAGVEVDTGRITESVGILQDHTEKSELRTTMVETIHDEECMEEIAEELAGDSLYVLQPFVPKETVYDPVLAELPRTNPDYMKRMKDVVIGKIPNTIIRGMN